MTTTTPVRYPDLRSIPVMTRRAWWLVGMNILIPGSAQVLAGSRRLGRFGLGATLLLWMLAIAALVTALVSRETLITAATSAVGIWVIVLLAAFYCVLWVILTLDTLRLVRFVRVQPAARGLVSGLAIVAMIATSGIAGYAAYNGAVAAGALGSIFGDGNVADPVEGRYNILLLGGDAGPDREGLRPDSISVASVDAETGAVTLLGLPRNLQRVPFAADSPMTALYPDGYDCGDDCLLDYVYQEGNQNPDLYPDAEANGSTPAVEAVRDAAEGALGLTIQYYVLIDMQGFAQLIDALGGVTIDVTEEVLLGSNTFDDGSPADPIGVIEPGRQQMDGQTALWYARSRYATTDYARMARQRQVQEAIIAQADPANVVTKFQDVAAAGAQVVATDIPQPMLGHFIDLAQKGRALPVASLDFVPPEYDVVYPDYAAIHAAVDAAVAPAVEEGSG